METRPEIVRKHLDLENLTLVQEGEDIFGKPVEDLRLRNYDDEEIDVKLEMRDSDYRITQKSKHDSQIHRYERCIFYIEEIDDHFIIRMSALGEETPVSIKESAEEAHDYIVDLFNRLKNNPKVVNYEEENSPLRHHEMG
jgi:hypothetical protein